MTVHIIVFPPSLTPSTAVVQLSGEPRSAAGGSGEMASPTGTGLDTAGQLQLQLPASYGRQSISQEEMEAINVSLKADVLLHMVSDIHAMFINHLRDNYI